MQKTILIVDNDRKLRDFLRKMLVVNNFKVIEATDGAQALEMIEKTPPDLVILELLLPKVPGETVCVNIKNNHPNIAVIVLTAKSRSVDVIRGLQIGANDYITKPFVAEELLARIENQLKSTGEKNIEQEEVLPSVVDPNLDKVKITLRESLALVAMRLIATEILLGLLFITTVTLISFLGPYLRITDLFSLYLIVLAILLLINIVIVILIVLRWQTVYTIVSKDGVVKYSGIFYKKEQKYACYFIESIKLYQSLLGIFLNYGTLELYDPALKERIYLLNISNPKKYRILLEKMLGKESNQPIPFVAK